MIFVKQILIVFFIWISTTCSAQQIISIDFESNISLGVGQLLLLTLGVNISLDTGIDIYRVTYEATGSDMRPDTASGLLMLPENLDGPVPILVYQHGTTDGRSDVPSNLAGGYQLGAIFAGKGMAVIAPDFLGMGTSRGFHPYVHAETEATASVDMIDAVLEYFGNSGIEWNEQLLITGYSQGGHAAMALHQYIEEVIPDRFTVTAALPMSGPYNISGVMRDLAFMDEAYGFPAYLVYSARGSKEINTTLYEDESDLYKAPFLPAIRKFVSTGEGLFDMNESIIQLLISIYGEAAPKHIFKDSILNVIESDPDHPFNIALAEKDVHDWAPEAPVFMLYCTSDDQVPYRNSIVADSLMNLNGAVDTRSMDVSGGAILDHSACIVPALNTGIPWLLGFVDSTVPVFDLGLEQKVIVYPNPTLGILNISSDIQIEKIEIYSMGGAMMFSETINKKGHALNLSGFTHGMYLAQVYTGEGLIVRKIIIQ